MFKKSLLLASVITFASTNNVIKLHESPNADSKIISDIDISTGITILPSKWVQVQDPTTKKVGWVSQQEVQNILQNNNSTITTKTSNTNGNYSLVTEIHNFATNEPQNNDLAKNITKNQDRIKTAFKKNMRYFQKMDEVTNSIFDNIMGEKG